MVKAASVNSKAQMASYLVAYRIAKCKKPHDSWGSHTPRCSWYGVNYDWWDNRRTIESYPPVQWHSCKTYMQLFRWSWRTYKETKRQTFCICKWTRLLAVIKTVYLFRMFDLSIPSQWVRICCFASTSHAEQQLMSSTGFLTVTWQNTDWNGRTVWAFARMAHRPCQGKEVDCRHFSPNAQWTHCVIHREARASRQFSSELNKVLTDVVSVTWQCILMIHYCMVLSVCVLYLFIVWFYSEKCLPF